MKIRKILLVFLVFIMLNINTLAWGSFLPDSKQCDCLSPSVQINFSTLQDSFGKLAENKNIDIINSSGKIPEKIDEQLLTEMLNKVIGSKNNNIIFTAEKPEKTFMHSFRPEEYTPMKVRFKWRWDKKSDTLTDRAVVVTAEVIDVDPMENPFFNSVLSRGNYPKVMDMMFLIGENGLDISHIDVRDVVQKKGAASFLMEKLSALADGFSNGKVSIVHIVNRQTISILHEFVATRGKGIEAVDSHLQRYPEIFQKGKINNDVLAEFLGKDILLQWDIDQQVKRERYITSLANALEAMEKTGIKVNDQATILDSPIIKMLKSAGYKDIKLDYDDYTAEVDIVGNGKSTQEALRTIVINSQTAIAPENEGKFKDVMKQKIIANRGKISFAEAMEDALYHKDHGFFAKKVGVGRDQSFDTHASNLAFAHSMAVQIIEMWEKMGRIDNFKIVEMGAGSGILAKNIVEYIKQNKPDLFNSFEYLIVDISEKLKSDQESVIEALKEDFDDLPVRTIKGNAFDLSELKDIEGVFISNEMPDNFPIHRVRKVNGEFQEVYVTFKDGSFQDELGPISNQELQDYIDNLTVDIKDGAEIPVNLNLRLWQKNLGQALKKGFVITIDYGGKINQLVDKPSAVWNMETDKGQLDRQQSMEYIYERFGDCDITSMINFYDQARWGMENGLQVQGYTLERDFLWNLGVDDIIDELLTREENRGKQLNNFSNEIATNLHMKVLVQSKGVDLELKLKGFIRAEESLDDYYDEGGIEESSELDNIEGLEGIAVKSLINSQYVSVVLPFGPEASKFIVYTSGFGASNFDKYSIEKGLQAVKESIRTTSHYTKIITPDGRNIDEGNIENGKYVIYVKRSTLEDGMEIYDDKGQRLFSGWQFFNGIEDQLLIENAKKYSTRFDLNRADYEENPDIFFLHQDGSLQTYSPEFLPSNVLDNKSSLGNDFNLQIERAI